MSQSANQKISQFLVLFGCIRMFVYISRALDREVWYQVCLSRLEDGERNHANSNNKNKGIYGLRSRSAIREIELFEGEERKGKSAALQTRGNPLSISCRGTELSFACQPRASIELSPPLTSALSSQHLQIHPTTL
jgi:hypothetical protein